METFPLFESSSQGEADASHDMLDARTATAETVFPVDFRTSPEKSPASEREGLPAEHTLSSDEKWAYPGGNFGYRLSQNLLEDPRIRDLSLKTLGLYVMLRAAWEAGRPIPAKSKLGAKNFGITLAAWTNCLDELSVCLPPMIEIRQGFVLPTSFGKPIPKGLSEVRALAAHARHERLKSQDGHPRPPEPPPEMSAASQVAADPRPSGVLFDLFGQEILADAQLQNPCPYGDIMALFVKFCPSLPAPIDVKQWPGTRKKRIGEIWKKNPKLEFWQAFFDTVESSDWLCGRTGKPWMASLDWIIDQKNMHKILEGNYSKNSRPNMFQGGRFNVGSYGSHDIDPSAAWLTPDDATPTP